MKVVAFDGSPVQSSGVGMTVDMGISTDPEDQLMILNVLSNTLYSDKIAAVLREYGCNGMDANVEAGKGDQPIEVRLPNKIDPTLSIRDYGHGMSEQQILNVFCRLGRSTKRNSNEFTGMLGIGSKAGFAYGDAFVVTSWCNGTKSVYNCHRDKGAPRLGKMHEGPSEAPDGIEVKVPIRMEDFPEFVLKAERIFRYFKVRPKILGAKVDWQARGVPEFEGTGWRYTGIGTSVAIMGNVGYDLNTRSLPTSYTDVDPATSGYVTKHVDTRLRTLIELGVELDFDIGDLEIAANREGLQYKAHTITSIMKRLEAVSKEVVKVFTDRISKASSYWEACRLYGDNFEKMGRNQYGMRTLKEVVTGKLMWQGKQITSARFSLENTEALPGITVTSHTKNYGTVRKWMQCYEVYASDKATLCINDLPTHANSPSRVKGFFQANPLQETLVIFNFADDKVQKKYWKARMLDGAPTINLSSITPALSTHVSSSSGPSAHRAKHSAKVFKLVPTTPATNSATRSAWWTNADVDLEDDSGIYVIIDKFFAKVPDMRNHGAMLELRPEQLLADVAAAQKAGLIKGPVYGFKKALTDKIGKGWVELSVEVANNFKTWLAANKQAIADADAALAHKEWVSKTWAADFNAATQMHKYLRSFQLMKENGKATADVVYSVRHKSSYLIPHDLGKLPTPTHDLPALSKLVRSTYPLLDLLDENSNGYIWQRHMTDVNLAKLKRSVVEYVRLVNK